MTVTIRATCTRQQRWRDGDHCLGLAGQEDAGPCHDTHAQMFKQTHDCLAPPVACRWGHERKNFTDIQYVICNR